jgi:hypothetical protein
MGGYAQVVEYEPNRKVAFEYPSGPLKGSMERSSVENVEGKKRRARKVDQGFLFILSNSLNVSTLGITAEEFS